MAHPPRRRPAPPPAQGTHATTSGAADADALGALAREFAEQGLFGPAAKAAKKALALEPESTVAKGVLKYTFAQAGSAAARLGQIRRAQSRLRGTACIRRAQSYISVSKPLPNGYIYVMV